MIDHIFIPLATIYLIGIAITYSLLRLGNGNEDCWMTQGEMTYCSILWPLLLIYAFKHQD